MGIRTLAIITLGVCLLGLCEKASRAGTAPQFFDFVIPWDDASPNNATDMSFLNAKPAGVNGYVVAKGGHFVESKTGQRVRFLGTSFTFANDFPTHSDAEKVAAHLAKMGINIVRIHHHDADYGELWDKNYKDHRHIDAGARDRLDYLIYQLKLHGIYVDLNLHVSRQFTPEDGFPASINDIPFGYDKRVDYYDPRMIQLQKEFAKDYLGHVNPYTHMSYTEDPCVAMIEINNENSLVGDPWATMGQGLDTVPEPFKGELMALWTKWLAKWYKTDAAVRESWLRGLPPVGPQLITPDSKWGFEHQTDASMTPDPSAASTNGAPAIHVSINQIDGTVWHIQTSIGGLNLQDGKTYTLTFYAKSDAPRKLSLSADLDEADWHGVGLEQSVQLGTDLKKYVCTFKAVNTVPNHDRVIFMMGDQTGQVWLSGVSLHEGQSPDELGDFGTLETGMKYEQPVSDREHQNWLSFLADTELAYVTDMRSYLKDTLHTHANIIGSQISWGHAAGFYREQDSDYADNHAYWQHPGFPHKAWDAVDWNIKNTPMVDDLGPNGNGGVLRDLAEYRVAGKPYSISEFNEPAPNDYRCEALPIIASYAAAQDLDALFMFDWGDYGDANGSRNSMIQGFFATGSDPARAGFLPAAAVIFRMHPELSTLPNAETLHFSEVDELNAVDVTAIWKRFGDNSQEYLDAAFRAKSFVNYNGPPISAEPLSPKSTTSIHIDVSVLDKPIYTYQSDNSNVACGYLGDRTVPLGPFTVHADPFGNGFCSVTVNKRSANSYLVTVIGKAENHNMGWNADRTSVGNQWGNAPSQAEYVPLIFTAPKLGGHGSGKLKVYALDSTGKPEMEIPVNFVPNLDIPRFETDPNAHTIWYLVQLQN